MGAKYFALDQSGADQAKLRSSGHGIRRYDNSSSLVAAMETDQEWDLSPDGVMLLQQYIPSEYVHRLEFVGGKFLYAVLIRTSSSFNHCPCENSTDESCAVEVAPAFSISPEFPSTEGEGMLVQALERMLRSFTVDIAGIELVRDSRQRWWVIDCNCCNTNYNRRAEVRAKVGMGGNTAIARWLQAADAAPAAATAVPPSPPPDRHSDTPPASAETDEQRHPESCTPDSS